MEIKTLQIPLVTYGDIPPLARGEDHVHVCTRGLWQAIIIFAGA